MPRPRLTDGRRAAVLVAHPDDETIWMGGCLLSYPLIKWEIISLCRGGDPDRAPKFQRVCERYGALGRLADFDDEGRVDLAASVPALEKIIAGFLSGHAYDYIFTHGAGGEYGHERHRGVHQAVVNLLASGRLRAREVFFFHYRRRPRPDGSLAPRAQSDWLLPLPPAIFAAKQRIMTGIYGFAPDGIDTRYCPNPEAYKIFENKL